MNAVKPTILMTPDGVERELRFTLGARKRIQETFGSDLQTALNTYDAGAYPGILHALMHDSKGNPPDISIEELAESLPIDSAPEVLAAIMAAMTQGRVSKNDLEVQIKGDMDKAIESMLTVMLDRRNGGSASGLSAPLSDTSASPTESFGGDISNAKSPHSSRGMKSRNVSSTTAAA